MKKLFGVLLLGLCVSALVGANGQQQPAAVPEAEKEEVYAGDANGMSSDQAKVLVNDALNAKIDWKQFKGTKLRGLVYSSVSMSNLASSARGFKKLTGIDLTIETIAAKDIFDKLLIEFNSGTPPDVVLINIVTLAQYATSKWIVPLQDLVGNPKITDPAWYDVKDIIAAGVDYMTYNKVWYGVPLTNEIQLLYYRKDLYKEKNLKVPTTMDELYENAKALNTPDMAGFVSRFARDSGSAWVFMGLVRNYGGYILTPDGKVTINTPEFKRAAQMYVKLMKDTAPAGIVNYTYAEEQNAYMSGKAAQGMDSSGFYATFEDATKSVAAGKTGYAMLPSGVPGQPSIANCNYWGMGVSTASKNKEAAWLFVQFATAKPMARYMALKRGMLTRNSSIGDELVTSRYPADWVNALGTAKTDKYAAPQHPSSTSILEEVMITLQNIYNKPEAIDSILAETQKRVEEIVAKK